MDERMERLRSRKASVAHERDERRAATRFEPVADAIADDLDDVIDDVAGGPGSASSRSSASSQTATIEVDEDDYTARLMKAKKKKSLRTTPIGL